MPHKTIFPSNHPTYTTLQLEKYVLLILDNIKILLKNHK